MVTQRTTVVSTITFGLLLLFSLAPLLCAANPILLPLKDESKSFVQAKFEQGLLTVACQNVKLSEVLKVIGEVSGFSINLRGEFNTLVTESIVETPLEDGIRHLLRAHSFALIFHPKSPSEDSDIQTAAATTRANPATDQPRVGSPSEPWSVQVRSSPKRSDADVLRQSLIAKGFAAFTVSAMIHGSTWHRVRVGPVENKFQAEMLRRRITAATPYHDAFITNEPLTVALGPKKTLPVDMPKAETPPTRAGEITIIEVAPPPVPPQMMEPNPVDTLRLVHSLARQKDPAALAELHQIAQTDPDPIVRAAAREAIGQLGAIPRVSPASPGLPPQLFVPQPTLPRPSAPLK